MPPESLRVTVVILHVVGEEHELDDIGEALEFGVLKAFVDAVAFCDDAFAVVGFFYFDKDQWHAIDQ